MIIGFVFPAEAGVLGLFGRVVEDGNVEHGFLQVQEDGSVKWVPQDEAYAEDAPDR